ncbi:MAG: Nif3-like dinuclear metal center hexameric protein [Clostridiaceae bacterium]|nr:Nif3-like dinuclear metal center hexameric protein [Clostridiaceae bacterium]
MTKNWEIIEAIEKYAPIDLAEEWDQPGLAFGSFYAEVKGILLALDLTPELVREAAEKNIELLIVHHPPLFNAIHSLTDATVEGKMQLDLITKGISCYSAHTNLDRSPGGIAAGLARKLQLDVEEEAYQTLMPLEGRPEFGYGLYATLCQEQSFFDFERLIAKRLEIPACQRFNSKNSQLKKIALFPGSFDESCILRLEEIAADVLICGEIKHHLALMLEARDIRVLAVGHDVSERDGMNLLAAYLSCEFPELKIEVKQGIDYN